MSSPRVLAILGSGETAPAMSSVHSGLLARLAPEAAAVMLDTPYGFQENADEISARSVNYFAHNVGHPIEVVSFRDAATATALEYERMCAAVAVAEYVFAGPGSPSYALRQWQGTRVPELLAAKLREGGIVVFASAAAVGLGEVALPVYEVYKVGEPARWLAGLNLLAETGLRAAVIPHFNNAEGGTHDTRYCYMGERRLRVLEEALPEGCAILGVDEHTACVIDIDAGTMTVRGPGAVTWRVAGDEQRWSSGETTPLAALAPAPGGSTAPRPSPVSQRTAPAVDESRRRALTSLARGAVDDAVAAALELETQGHEATATANAPQAARAALRELIVHLGTLAGQGTADPRERLQPLVAALLGVRDRARAERRFADADAVRDALRDAGVEVQDTPQGSTWQLAGTR